MRKLSFLFLSLIVGFIGVSGVSADYLLNQKIFEIRSIYSTQPFIWYESYYDFSELVYDNFDQYKIIGVSSPDILESYLSTSMNSMCFDGDLDSIVFGTGSFNFIQTGVVFQTGYCEGDYLDYIPYYVSFDVNWLDIGPFTIRGYIKDGVSHGKLFNDRFHNIGNIFKVGSIISNKNAPENNFSWSNIIVLLRKFDSLTIDVYYNGQIYSTSSNIHLVGGDYKRDGNNFSYDGLTGVNLEWVDEDNQYFNEFYSKKNLFLGGQHTKSFTGGSNNYYVFNPYQYHPENDFAGYVLSGWTDMEFESDQIFTGNVFESFYTQFIYLITSNYPLIFFVLFGVALVLLLLRVLVFKRR